MQELAVADLAAPAACRATVGMDCRARRLRSRPATVLLVFDGQPRIFFAMARDGLFTHGRRRSPGAPVPRSTSSPVLRLPSPLIGDAAETYDLTNIGTLFAFAIVCAGVLVLRYTGSGSSPSFPGAVRLARHRARRRRVRVHHAGAAAATWERFGLWLAIGLPRAAPTTVSYSRLRQSS